MGICVGREAWGVDIVTPRHLMNEKKELDIEMSDTNEQIFNFLTKILHFCMIPKFTVVKK